MAKAVAIAPKASQQITQSTIPLIYASLAADMDLPIDLSNLHNIAPSSKTYYDPATRKIQEYMLDIDSSGENSREVAYAIQHALKKLQLIDDGFSLVLCGQTTDSGGGGTLHSLARELKNLGLPFRSYYLVASCSLHNLMTS